MDQKIRDLPAASTLALADLLEVTTDPSGSPASKKATLEQLQSALRESMSWVDLVAATVALPAASGGDYTLGSQFCALRAGQSCTGVRFYWASATPRTIKVGLYKTGIGLMASATVAVSGAGLYAASFAATAIDGTSDWYATVYETTGAEYTAHVALSARVPARPMVLGNYVLIHAGAYAGGDVIPTSGTHPASNGFLIEPIVEG